MKRSQREAFRDEAGLICNALEKTYAAIEAKNSLMAQKIEALNSELKAARSEIAALKPELEAVKRDIGKTGGGLESCLAAVGDGVSSLTRGGRVSSFTAHAASVSPSISRMIFIAAMADRMSPFSIARS